jgi:tetratricopeptide (TPR) repeat protein
MASFARVGVLPQWGPGGGGGATAGRRRAPAPPNIPFQVMLVRALVDAGRAAEVLAMPEPAAITSPALLALWQGRAEAADCAGRVDLAADAWSRVARSAPADWRAWSNLGNALAAQGHWGQAADALEKAAQLNPSDLSIRRNAGSALAQADRLQEAIGHLDAVAAADPTDVENRTMLGRALTSLQRHDEAIVEFEAAKKLGGASVATELGLGRIAFANLRFDEAEAAFRRAYEIDPTDHSVVLRLGLVLERTNQLHSLKQLVEEALSSGLHGARLTHLQAALARREGRLEEARELLLKSDPKDEPVAWNALRAKIADALGDPAEAFAAATAMNQAARDSAARTVTPEEQARLSNAYREELHQLARTITPEWAARVPLLREPAPRRVSFLLGFPRSGTTLLDTFLMGHPRIEVLEEKQLVGAARTVAGPIEDLAGAPIAAIENARATYLATLSEHVADDFDGLVIDKYPLDMASAPLIQAMFPGAPIIFAQRHPCDVVLSGFMQSFGLTNFSDIRDAADYYDAVMSIWTASRATMSLNVHTVVYEDLVRDPEAALRPTIEFLEQEWTDEILDHRRTAKERGTIATPSYDQVTEPVSTRPSGRWKRYRAQLEPVLPILLPWAERLGYRD